MTYADQEELLVCKNFIIRQVEDDVQLLHHNIFHMQCTLHGNFCDVCLENGHKAGLKWPSLEPTYEWTLLYKNVGSM